VTELGIGFKIMLKIRELFRRMTTFNGLDSKFDKYMFSRRLI